MSQITIEIDQAVYEQLRREADRIGKPAAVLAGDLLRERLFAPVLAERERAREVLRAAGLLVEPTPEMRAIAAQSTATLEEIQAIFARVGGKPLSELVLEQRGPTE